MGKKWDYIKDRALNSLSFGLPDLVSGVSDALDKSFEPTTQTSTSAPWEAQQPYLQDIFSIAQELYGQGSTLPPLSPYTEQALGAQWDAAQANPYLQPMTQGLMGLSGYQNPYASGFGQYQGMTDPMAAQYAGLDVMAPEAQQMFRETAQGDYLGSNPYLDAMYEQAAGKVGEQFQNITMPGISTAFSQAGRFGSPAQMEATEKAQSVLGDTLSGMASNLYGGAYESERARQEAAKGGFANVMSGGLGRQLQSLGAQGAGQRFYDQMGLGALGTQAGLSDVGAGIQTSALSMLPTARGMQVQDLGLMRDVGQAYDIYGQQQAREPWNRLGLYQGAISGNYGGTQTMPGPSPFQNMLGIASDVASIASPFLMPGQPQNPYSGFMAQPGSMYQNPYGYTGP